MKKRILMTAAAALALLLPAMAQETSKSPDQLRMFTGKLDAHSGAAAEGRIEEGVFTITNTADAGHIIACGSKLLDLTPGRDYEVSCDLEMAEGSSGALMISMPGGKRRPYPQKILTAGGKAVLRFTAREDEKKLALYLVVYRGTVTFRELHVRQLPPLDPTRKIFEGEELVRAWHVENAALDKSGGEALCGLAGPTTRIVSSKLDWNASEVKAVELDASFFPEGGLLELRFTGEANGKTFSSFTGVCRFNCSIH